MHARRYMTPLQVKFRRRNRWQAIMMIQLVDAYMHDSIWNNILLKHSLTLLLHSIRNQGLGEYTNPEYEYEYEYFA